MQKSYKILITTFTYLPALDGVSMATANLAEGLAQRGHDVSVVTSRDPARSAQNINGVPVYEFDVGGSPSRRIGFHGEVAGYQDFLKSFACDILVCQYWNVWSTYLAQQVFPQISACKVLVSHGFSFHLWSFHSRPFFGVGQWLGNLAIAVQLPYALKLYNRVVFLSKKRDLRRFIDHLAADLTGFRGQAVIPNGIWAKEFAAPSIDFRSEHNLSKERPLILCVANYSKRKNQRRALRVFVQAELDGAALVFIGSEINDYARMLQQDAAALKASGLRNPVYILEGLSRTDTCAAYHAADAFILTAEAETQPIVLLEAMACGVPYVAVPSGAISEMPGGVTALTDRSLARALRRTLQNRQWRSTLAREGRNAVATLYNWPSVLDSYELMFSQVLAEAKGTGRPQTTLSPAPR